MVLTTGCVNVSHKLSFGLDYKFMQAECMTNKIHFSMGVYEFITNLNITYVPTI